MVAREVEAETETPEALLMWGRADDEMRPSEQTNAVPLSLLGHTHSSCFMHRVDSNQLVQLEHALRAHPLSLPTYPRIISN